MKYWWWHSGNKLLFLCRRLAADFPHQSLSFFSFSSGIREKRTDGKNPHGSRNCAYSSEHFRWSGLHCGKSEKVRTEHFIPLMKLTYAVMLISLHTVLSFLLNRFIHLFFKDSSIFNIYLLVNTFLAYDLSKSSNYIFFVKWPIPIVIIMNTFSYNNALLCLLYLYNFTPSISKIVWLLKTVWLYHNNVILRFVFYFALKLWCRKVHVNLNC